MVLKTKILVSILIIFDIYWDKRFTNDFDFIYVVAAGSLIQMSYFDVFNLSYCQFAQ